MKEKISRLFAKHLSNRSFDQNFVQDISSIENLLKNIQCLSLDIEIPYKTIEK